jgi:arsenate reductase
MKRRVLILCTGNSARSQIAEGLLRKLAGDRIDVFSAGTQPSTVNPLAIKVMAEWHIDIRQQRSKHVNEFLGQAFDDVITVCDSAAQSCPVFPGRVRRTHWSIPDPASATGSEADKLRVFRDVRGVLDSYLREWVGMF